VAAVPLSFAFSNSYDQTFSSALASPAMFEEAVRQRVAAVIGWAADFVLEVRAVRSNSGTGIVMQMLVPNSMAWDR
jgi:hypothetical protein